MPNELKILGVYQLEATPEIFAAQLPMYGDEENCRHHFSSVVLIEAIAESEAGIVALSSITQPNPSYPGGFNQAPWDEGLFTLDGTTLLARQINCVKGHGPLRFAFFMHFWDERLPIVWKHGKVTCPPPSPMPDRLKQLMPYRPCD